MAYRKVKNYTKGKAGVQVNYMDGTGHWVETPKGLTIKNVTNRPNGTQVNYSDGTGYYVDHTIKDKKLAKKQPKKSVVMDAYKKQAKAKLKGC